MEKFALITQEGTTATIAFHPDLTALATFNDGATLGRSIGEHVPPVSGSALQKPARGAKVRRIQANCEGLSKRLFDYSYPSGEGRLVGFG